MKRKGKNSLTFSPRRVELDDLVYDGGVTKALADRVAHDLGVAAAGCFFLVVGLLTDERWLFDG